MSCAPRPRAAAPGEFVHARGSAAPGEFVHARGSAAQEGTAGGADFVPSRGVPGGAVALGHALQRLQQLVRWGLVEAAALSSCRLSLQEQAGKMQRLLQGVRWQRLLPCLGCGGWCAGGGRAWYMEASRLGVLGQCLPWLFGVRP